MNKKVVIVIIIVAVLIIAGTVVVFNFDTIKDWFVKSKEPAEEPVEKSSEKPVKEEEDILKKELPLLPTGKMELSAVDLGRFIVVSDGKNFYTYFKEENKWKESAHREFLSEDAVLEYIYLAKLLSLEEKVYIVEPAPRDKSSINRLIEYDPVNDDLKTYPLLTPRLQFDSAVFAGKIHAIGGLSGVPTRSLKDVDVFSPNEGKVVAGIPLERGRHDHQAVGLENYLIVINGKRQEISGPDVAYEDNMLYFKKGASNWKSFLLNAYSDAVFLPISEHEVIIVSGISSQKKILHYDFHKEKISLLKEFNLLHVFDRYIGAVIYDDYLYLFGLPSGSVQGADLYIVRFGIYNHIVDERNIHLGDDFVFALPDSDKNLIILQDFLDKRYVYLLGGKGFGATKEGESTRFYETLRKFFLLDLEKF